MPKYVQPTLPIENPPDHEYNPRSVVPWWYERGIDMNAVQQLAGELGVSRDEAIRLYVRATVQTQVVTWLRGVASNSKSDRKRVKRQIPRLKEMGLIPS